jgi:hypothetical protein
MQPKILFFLTITTLFGCTKVININLNKSNTQYVIEATVSNKSTVQTVLISKTVNFSDASNFPKVSNAVVTISDNNATPILLNLSTAGEYNTSSIQAIPGHTYELKILVDGKTFTAKSTMPQPVLLDSISFERQQSFGPNDDTTFFVTPNYLDPAQYVNYYRIAQKVDTIADITIFPFNDNLNNGLQNRRPIFSNNNDFKIKKGNTVKVELMGIDKNVYDYFLALSNIVATNGGPTTTPANPTSNISGGALGYFSAQTYHTVSKVVR